MLNLKYILPMVLNIWSFTSISIPLKLARKQSPILDLLNQDLLGGQQSGFNKSSTFILMHIKT